MLDSFANSACLSRLFESVDLLEADAYFATRARASQIGAWASLQSQTLAQRADLDARIAHYDALYHAMPVPRPPHWSGFRVLPDMLEFWFGAPSRLHDRSRHTLRDGVWTASKLYP